MVDALRWLPVAVSRRMLVRAVLVLLTALVLVQTMGLLHRVAHAHRTQAVVSVEAPLVSAEASDVLTRLWGEHSNLADCQLFDQACPDVLQHPPLNVVVVGAPKAWQVEVGQERFALFERFYAARGPPAVLL